MLNGTIAQHSRNKENDNSFKDRIWYGINLGNIGIGGNQFYINLSFMGGVKVIKNWNVGALVHTDYTYFWLPGNNGSFNIFDYGFGGMSTYKIYRNYFAQVEIDNMYISRFQNGEILERNPFLFTYLGGGYQYRSPGKWTSIITLLYNFNSDTNQIFFPLNYRFAFVYNF